MASAKIPSARAHALAAGGYYDRAIHPEQRVVYATREILPRGKVEETPGRSDDSQRSSTDLKEV